MRVAARETRDPSPPSQFRKDREALERISGFRERIRGASGFASTTHVGVESASPAAAGTRRFDVGMSASYAPRSATASLTCIRSSRSSGITFGLEIFWQVGRNADDPVSPPRRTVGIGRSQIPDSEGRRRDPDVPGRRRRVGIGQGRPELPCSNENTATNRAFPKRSNRVKPRIGSPSRRGPVQSMCNPFRSLLSNLQREHVLFGELLRIVRDVQEKPERNRRCEVGAESRCGPRTCESRAAASI